MAIWKRPPTTRHYFLYCPECEGSNIYAEIADYCRTKLTCDEPTGEITYGEEEIVQDKYFFCADCFAESDQIETFLNEKEE